MGTRCCSGVSGVDCHQGQCPRACGGGRSPWGTMWGGIPLLGFSRMKHSLGWGEENNFAFPCCDTQRLSGHRDRHQACGFMVQRTQPALLLPGWPKSRWLPAWMQADRLRWQLWGPARPQAHMARIWDVPKIKAYPGEGTTLGLVPVLGGCQETPKP